MGYEDRLVRFLDLGSRREVGLDPKIKENARKVLARKKLDTAQFAGVFSNEKIAADIAYVTDREETFETNRGIGAEQKESADAFEAFLHYAIEKADWFGEGTQTLPVAPIDDYKNGVDILLETTHDHGFSHLSLGLDVTFSQEKISKKFETSARTMRQESRLGKVEYFHSSRMGIKGSMENIPYVVVGLERERVNEMLQYLKSPNKENLKKEMYQFIVLEQIKLQLQGFLNYINILALSEDRKAPMREKLALNLKQVEYILAQKAALKDTLFVDEKDYQKVLQNDGIFRAIEDCMKVYNPVTTSARTVRR